MTPQEELYQAYHEARGTIWLEILAMHLRAHHGFSGRIETAKEFKYLSDEQARAALKILPNIILPPAVSHEVVLASLRKDFGPDK